MKTSVSYVPGIITLGIIAASFVNLVISVTAQRESGILKRRRATPVPAAAIIGGRALTAVVAAFVITAVLLLIGWAAYGANVPGRTGPALFVTVAIGALSFCCIGYALASLIHDEDAAQPVTQALVLPLYFISGVFVAASQLPHWLVDIAALFPVAPRSRATHGLQPAHDRIRLRLDRPPDRRRLGNRRTGRRSTQVQLDPRAQLEHPLQTNHENQRRGAMKTEVERKTGNCPTHGRVEGTREIPRMQFPYIYFWFRRRNARQQPFHCPTCDTPLERQLSKRASAPAMPLGRGGPVEGVSGGVQLRGL